ncbi:hypothetical protein DKM19_28200 [Streptosporangium sp. 'caverna']|nr:hypothetical protein DKM19_28200 [Streptosporangium sp. 'caverna']
MIGGLLAGLYGWRAIFLINVPIGLVVLAALRQRIPESVGRGHLDPLGSLAVTAALFAIIPGLIHEIPWLVALGVVLLGGFVVVELRSTRPMMDFGLLRDRTFAVGPSPPS